MEKKVKLYLESLKGEEKLIVEELRRIITHNFPLIKETAMKEGLWYDGKFYLTSFIDHVNLGVGVLGLSKKESIFFEGKGKTMKHLKFYSLEQINEKELIKLLKLVYEKSKCECKINWKNY